MKLSTKIQVCVLNSIRLGPLNNLMSKPLHCFVSIRLLLKKEISNLCILNSPNIIIIAKSVFVG